MSIRRRSPRPASPRQLNSCIVPGDRVGTLAGRGGRMSIGLVEQAIAVRARAFHALKRITSEDCPGQAVVRSTLVV